MSNLLDLLAFLICGIIGALVVGIVALRDILASERTTARRLARKHAELSTAYFALQTAHDDKCEELDEWQKVTALLTETEPSEATPSKRATLEELVTALEQRGEFFADFANAEQELNTALELVRNLRAIRNDYYTRLENRNERVRVLSVKCDRFANEVDRLNFSLDICETIVRQLCGLDEATDTDTARTATIAHLREVSFVDYLSYLANE